MSKARITPILLAGGAGTRLWPLSRELYPKQLLSLTNEKTMLQDTLARLDGLALNPPIVVCSQEHRFMVAQQLRDVGMQSATIILEPVGRNTAPAAAIGALEVARRLAQEESTEDGILLLLPADHVIRDTGGFRQAVEVAADLAEENRLITFGVVPDTPNTGYGYIKRGDQIVENAGFLVAEFVEKPDLAAAKRYLKSGKHFWNSGMFLFSLAGWMGALEQHAGEILTACRRSHEGARRESDFIWLHEEHFQQCPSDSIDYAVMEKTEQGMVLPIDVSWSDIGSWSALADIGDPDEDGNIFSGDVWTLDSKNSYLRADHRMVAAVGVENLIVVETADVVLVAEKERVQEVKNVVERLKKEGREEATVHRKAYRPWGSYEQIGASEGWQAKCIRVNPGASLSLQMHNHRAEHWVVVKGEAEVTRGEDVFILKENESTFIPVGEKHRLRNAGVAELELIEVQSGEYLGEDDILRLEDLYGR